MCCPLLAGRPPCTELSLWLQGREAREQWAGQEGSPKAGSSSVASTFALGKEAGEPWGLSGTLCKGEQGPNVQSEGKCVSMSLQG